MKLAVAAATLLVAPTALGAWTSPCTFNENFGLPFCDTSLDLDTRVADLLSRLSKEDKITKGDSLLSNTGKEIPHLHMEQYEWWSEALHGVANSPGVNFDGSIPAASSFPQPLHSSQSFNRTLFQMLGEAISTEARAMYNAGQAGLTCKYPLSHTSTLAHSHTHTLFLSSNPSLTTPFPRRLDS
jgi:hypothetical protein